MKSVKKRIATTLLAVASATTVVGTAAPANAELSKPAPKPTGKVSSLDTHCWTFPTDVDHGQWIYPVKGDWVRMRVGPNLGCEISDTAYDGDRLDYHCYWAGDSGSWTFVHNVTRATYGWIRDDYLDHDGSFTSCTGLPSWPSS
jgi:hypothetical protein